MKHLLIVLLVIFSLPLSSLGQAIIPTAADAAGVASSSWDTKNLSALYVSSAAAHQPLYLTADLAFEQTHVFYATALQRLEQAYVTTRLTTLLEALLQSTQEAQSRVSENDVRAALAGNVLYLQTALALLTSEPKTEGRVAEEIALIQAAAETRRSPVLGYQEDYTQYIVRGHYTLSAPLQRYFRTLTWLGRAGFYLQANPAAGIDEPLAAQLSTQGILLSACVTRSAAAQSAFTDLEQFLHLWVGESDDLSVPAVATAAAQVLQGKWTMMPDTQVFSSAVLQQIRTALRTTAPRPRILSTVANAGTPVPLSVRLLGQRFLPDSWVFQTLTFDRVRDFRGTGTPLTLTTTPEGQRVRGVPRAYDFLAALGSTQALRELERTGDTAYQGYREQQLQLQQALPSVLNSTNSFYSAYVTAVQHHVLDKDAGRLDTELQRLKSAFGAWVLLRHDVAAYAKQSYTSLPRALHIEGEAKRPLPTIYVAPARRTFQQLARAVALLLPTLQTAGLTSLHAEGTALQRTFQRLARKAGKAALAPAEAQVMYAQLQAWSARGPLALVADVHTDAIAGQVLQVAVGDAVPVWIEVPIKGKRARALAATFSCYEFRRAQRERLTDEQWRKELQQKQQTFSRL